MDRLAGGRTKLPKLAIFGVFFVSKVGEPIQYCGSKSCDCPRGCKDIKATRHGKLFCSSLPYANSHTLTWPGVESDNERPEGMWGSAAMSPVGQRLVEGVVSQVSP